MNIKRQAIFLFFILFLIFGLIISVDYGMSTDEPIQRIHGLVSAKYISEQLSLDTAHKEIFQNIPLLESYQYKNYGVVFHLPAIFIEIYSRLPEPDLWRFRHAYTFSWFFIATIFFYLLVSRRYGWKIALTACAFFILTPRIFADSFFNVKDLAFLSAFTISIYFAVIYLERKSFGAAFLLAFSVAVASNIRMAGLLLPVIVCLFFLVDALKVQKFDKKAWGSLFLLLSLTFVLTIAFWPAAWKDPIQLIRDSVALSINYTKWDGTIIYRGDLVRGANLPWHYIPVWFSITTPISYLVLSVMGMFVMVRKAGDQKGILSKIDANKEDLLYLMIFTVPIGLVIIFHSTLYGGWRHLFFIYPAFLLISINGFAWLVSTARKNTEKRATWGKALASLALCGLIVYSTYIAYWMIKNHPHQFVYFNSLAGNNIAHSFDRDYWGLSAKAGLEFITNNDKRTHIKVAGTHIENNMRLLSENDRARIRPVSLSDAEYFVETYRNVRGSSPLALTGKEIYFVSVDNYKIMSIFDMQERRTHK